MSMECVVGNVLPIKINSIECVVDKVSPNKWVWNVLLAKFHQTNEYGICCWQSFTKQIVWTLLLTIFHQTSEYGICCWQSFTKQIVWDHWQFFIKEIVWNALAMFYQSNSIAFCCWQSFTKQRVRNLLLTKFHQLKGREKWGMDEVEYQRLSYDSPRSCYNNYIVYYTTTFYKITIQCCTVL